MKDYDLQKMQELLHDFYNLTNMKICIYDSAENELCYYPAKADAVLPHSSRRQTCGRKVPRVRQARLCRVQKDAPPRRVYLPRGAC